MSLCGISEFNFIYRGEAEALWKCDLSKRMSESNEMKSHCGDIFWLGFSVSAWNTNYDSALYEEKSFLIWWTEWNPSCLSYIDLRCNVIKNYLVTILIYFYSVLYKMFVNEIDLKDRRLWIMCARLISYRCSVTWLLFYSMLLWPLVFK